MANPNRDPERPNGQRVFELQLTNTSLRFELDGTRTRNAQLTRDLAAARAAVFEKEDEARQLRNHLAATEAGNQELRKLLDGARLGLARLAESSDGFQSQAANAESELLALRGQNVGLKATNTAGQEMIAELRNERELHVARLAEAEKVRVQRDRVVIDSGAHKRNAVLAKSRAGNLLVGTARVGFMFYLLETFSGFPVLGKYFESASVRLYEHYFGARSKSGPHKK